MKKATAIICILALMLGIPVFAGAAPALSVDAVNTEAGQSVQVPVRISGNTGILGAKIDITYDGALTLTSVTAGSALSTLAMTKPGNLSANPVSILWDGMDGADTSNGVIATLTFTAPSDAGTYPVSISYKPGAIVDGDLHSVTPTLQSGSVTVEGETPPPVSSVTLSADAVTAEAGQSVQVPVRISGNTGILGAKIDITYDGALTLTSVSAGSALSTLAMTKPGNLSANPVSILWDGMDGADASNGVIAVLTFTAPESAGSYPVSISYKPGAIVDGDLHSVTPTLQSGSVTVEGETPPPASSVTISADDVNTEAGQSVQVPVRISGNTGILGAKIDITYDGALTLTSVTAGSALSTLAMTKPGNLSANPVSILWDGMDGADTSNGIIAVLTFTAPDVAGTYPITVSYQPGAIVDGDLKAVSPVTEAGSVSVSNGGVSIKNVTASANSAIAAVYCPADVNAKVLCASYNGAEKFLKAEIKSVTSGADNNISVSVTEDASFVQFIVLDASLNTPLCRSGKINVN